MLCFKVRNLIKIHFTHQLVLCHYGYPKNPFKHLGEAGGEGREEVPQNKNKTKQKTQSKTKQNKTKHPTKPNQKENGSKPKTPNQSRTEHSDSSVGALATKSRTRAPPLHPPSPQKGNFIYKSSSSVSQDEFDKRGDVCLFGFVQGEERMLLGKRREVWGSGRGKKTRQEKFVICSDEDQT